MLSDSKLATMVPPPVLFKIQRLGEVIVLKPRDILFKQGETPDYLYITLEGDLFIDIHPKPIWIGPGDIFGEIGFILGTKRTNTGRAGEYGCRLWRVHRSLLFEQPSIETTVLMTHLVIGLSPYINLRLIEISHQYRFDPTLQQKHCDHENPAIRYIASLLKGKDDKESAVNIWHFVRSMPYRFGFWNVKASQTLEFGFGMSTTKSNLQVALLRAINIESKFGECEIASEYLIQFLPSAYRDKITNGINHYFCIAKLEGRWICSDASFTREAAQLFAVVHPDYNFLINDVFTGNKDYLLETIDKKLEYWVLNDLSHIMHKRPFYLSNDMHKRPSFDANNIDAMNLLLDKVQGAFRPVPYWVESTLDLLSYNPKGALLRAISGIASDLTRLHNAYERRSADSKTKKTAGWRGLFKQ